MQVKVAVLVLILLLLLSSFALPGNSQAGSRNASTNSLPGSTQNSTGNAGVVHFNSSGNSSSPLSGAVSSYSGSQQSSQPSGSRYVYVPAPAGSIGFSDGHVQPLYTRSPAPMGVSDLGLGNSSGKVQGYEYNTSSFEGSITINSSNPFYLENDAPHTFSMQLNSVLAGVSLNGISNYTYWTQNVAFYSARNNTLSFVSNIWNFTSANATMVNSSIAKSVGNRYYYPGVYIAIGPVIKVAYPFTLRLYLNSSVLNSNDAVSFNYSIGFSNGTTESGQYNMVEFNSTASAASGYTAPPARFQVNGNSTAPNGLLYDSEFVLGGPGGGSTSEFYGLNATMSLQYLNSLGTYANVPSAYDFGSDTGETVSGVSESYSSAGNVQLGAGPSILFGMWNTTSSGGISSYGPGSVHYSGAISPSNGFMFVSPGNAFSISNSSWAPLGSSGSYSFNLPDGSFTAILMMSLYDPEIFSLKVGPSAMVYNPAQGIYTPLVARGNLQLAGISSSGSGTAADPYVIFNNSCGSTISSIFASVNDFLFPEFPGILLYNITDHVAVENMPSFLVNYQGVALNFLAFEGLPSSNNLNVEIYNSSNITVKNNAGVTGWFPAILQGFPLANLVIWNSTGTVVEGNQFDSLGSSVLIYNSNRTYSNNTVEGNTFAVDYTSNYAFSASYLYGFYDYGLELYSSNNTVYNNYFATILPVYSPSNDIYTGQNVTYQNFFSLVTGKTNILGGQGTGGNYWMNYIGQSTYDNYGQISGRGDSSPLTYYTGASLSASGIFQSTPWEIIVYRVVSLNGTPSILAGLESVKGINADYSLPNGTYDYVAAAQGQYFEAQGSFTVDGNQQLVNFQFLSNFTYNVTFRANGLPQGKNWFISLDDVGAYPNTEYLTYVGVPNGTYNFSAVSGGMSVAPDNGTITVSGHSVLINLYFTPQTFSVIFRESGLPPGSRWSINVNGTTQSTGGNALYFNESNGNYSYTVSSFGGYSAVSGGVVSVNYSNTTVFIKYTPVEIPFPTEIAVIMAAAGLIAGATVMFFISRRKNS